MRRQDTENPEWMNINFMVFDAPLVKGNFSQRLKVFQEEIAKMPETVCEALK